MNREGAYSGIIASIAIVAIIAVAFSSNAAVSAQAGTDYAKAIIDLKKEWQNAMYLLDKSASDAIADIGPSSGCTYKKEDVKDIVWDGTTGYFKDTLDEALLGACQASGIDVQGGSANNIRIQVDIYCNKKIGGIDIQYGKNRIEFRKEAAYDNSGGCKVDVRDKDSDVCEVDMIPNTSADDLCTVP